MTNFEHYKDELEETINNKTLGSFLRQHGCEYKYDTDLYNATEWYLAEYVKPYKLTKLEKIILENINPKLMYIIKEDDEVRIAENDKWTGIYITYPFTDAKFGCLKNGEYYKITDILLNCEVIGNDQF